MEPKQLLGMSGIVPVVVLEDADKAIPTANALLAGGLPVMEITLRTSAGLESIRRVAHECHNMLVGAGTVLTLDQCKACVEAGAKFIVSPGLDRDVVQWCVENGVTVTPGCVTPSEITEALRLGVDIIKFFPANVYGGLPAMNALSGPFGDVKFIPTGGINASNLGEYIAAPFIHAVGGSWLCSQADINAGNFDKITNLVKESLNIVMGFEMKHVGINSKDEDESSSIASKLASVFNFEYKPGSSSIFAGKGIEVMKTKQLGDKGHVAIGTNDIRRALTYLEHKGIEFDPESAKFTNGKMIAIYLKEEFGGFAFHLLQK